MIAWVVRRNRWLLGASALLLCGCPGGASEHEIVEEVEPPPDELLARQGRGAAPGPVRVQATGIGHDDLGVHERHLEVDDGGADLLAERLEPLRVA